MVMLNFFNAIVVESEHTTDPLNLSRHDVLCSFSNHPDILWTDRDTSPRHSCVVADEGIPNPININVPFATQVLHRLSPEESVMKMSEIAGIIRRGEPDRQTPSPFPPGKPIEDALSG